MAVNVVAAGHMGGAMVEMLQRMGLATALGMTGNARLAAVAAASSR